jgi:hypothetical protein
MIKLTLNGLPVSVEKGVTLLEAANFFGFPIPTLCYMEGLSPYGACRLCLVEIGEGPKAKLVTSCTYPAEEGLKAGLVPPIENHSGFGFGARGPAAALQTRTRELHPLRTLRAHVPRTNGGWSHWFPGPGRSSQPRHSVRHQIGNLPAVWRLHLCLPRLPAPLHVHGTRQGDLRRVREPESALPR